MSKFTKDSHIFPLAFTVSEIYKYLTKNYLQKIGQGHNKIFAMTPFDGKCHYL